MSKTDLSKKTVTTKGGRKRSNKDGDPTGAEKPVGSKQKESELKIVAPYIRAAYFKLTGQWGLLFVKPDFSTSIVTKFGVSHQTYQEVLTLQSRGVDSGKGRVNYSTLIVDQEELAAIKRLLTKSIDIPGGYVLELINFEGTTLQITFVEGKQTSVGLNAHPDVRAALELALRNRIFSTYERSCK